MKTSSVGRQLKSSFPGNFRQNRAIMFQLENLPRESHNATRINCIQVRFLRIYNKYVISSMYASFQWTLSEAAPNCGRIWPFCPQDILFSARVARRCKGHQSHLQNFSSVTAKLCHKLESKMNKETNWLGLTRSESQRINLCPSWTGCRRMEEMGSHSISCLKVENFAKLRIRLEWTDWALSWPEIL